MILLVELHLFVEDVKLLDVMAVVPPVAPQLRPLTHVIEHRGDVGGALLLVPSMQQVRCFQF